MSFVALNSTLPTLELELSTAAPLSGSPSWVSIIADVRAPESLRVRRGRNDELAEFNPGSFSCTFGNNGRKFDPDYSSSPLNGYLTPNRRIRLRAQWNGTTYIVFDGYANRWLQEYPSLGKDVIARLTATDGFKVLARTRLGAAPYDALVLADGPELYYKFDDGATPTVINDASPNNNDGTYSSSAEFTTGLIAGDLGSAYVAGAAIGAVGSITLSSVSSWVFECWISTTSTTRAVIAGFWANSTAFIVWLEASGQVRAQGGSEYYSSGVNVNDGDAHHIVIRRTGASQVEWVIDGTSGGTDTGTGTSALDSTGGTSSVGVSQIQIAPNDSGWTYGGVAGTGVRINATIDNLAVYNAVGDLTTLEAQAHYSGGIAIGAGDTTDVLVGAVLDSAGWPAGQRSLDTGDATLQGILDYQGVYALDLLQELWAAERGQFYMGLNDDLASDDEFHVVWRARSATGTDTRSTVSQATFTDASSDYVGIVTEPTGETFLFNEVEVTRRGGSPQVASDPTSIAAYTQSTLVIDGIELEDDAAALTLANDLLAIYKDPHTRIVALVIKPQGDPSNLWPAVLPREIGDLITVTITPAGVGSAITRDVLITGIEHSFQGLEWVVTFRLSEAESLI